METRDGVKSNAESGDEAGSNATESGTSHVPALPFNFVVGLY